jgi:uncharacterized membrane protein YeaQ/YmgE (transglycosylase-associated protein family)
MQIVILVAAMVLVGLLVGAVASLIWKEKPLGTVGDYVLAIVSAVIIGLLDWYVIPAMGFSDTLKWIGVAIEPALGALLVLWLVRRARK